MRMNYPSLVFVFPHKHIKLGKTLNLFANWSHQPYLYLAWNVWKKQKPSWKCMSWVSGSGHLVCIILKFYTKSIGLKLFSPQFLYVNHIFESIKKYIYAAIGKSVPSVPLSPLFNLALIILFGHPFWHQLPPWSAR